MEQVREFIQKNARSIVIVLIIAGVVATISLAGNNDDEASTDQQNEQTTSDTSENKNDTTTDAEVAQPDDGVTIGSEPEAGPVEVEEDKEQYRAEVRSGDNQTVIARQMVNEFLADESKNLNAKQRLYVETVVVDSLPRNDVIFVGEMIVVEKSVISSAVTEAESLSKAEQARWSAFL